MPNEEAEDEGGFDPGQDILPDSILDKHLGGGVQTAEDDPEDPEPESDDPPDDSTEDTSEEDPEGEEEDTGDAETDDGDEDPGDEPEDKGDEKDGDKEDDDEESEDVLDDKITPEDRARIEKDPSLRRVHGEMRRALTRKTQEVADRRRDVEAREERNRKFEDAVRTPDGMAGYLGRLLEKRSDIVGAAFEQVALSPAGPEFLVAVGLHNPEAFERAIEQFQDLQADPEAKKRYEADRDRTARDAKLEERENRLREQTFDRDHERVSGVMRSEAKRLGIVKDDMETVRDRLNVKIRAARQDDGSLLLTEADVKAVVQDAKKALDRIYRTAEERLSQKRASNSQRETQKRAARARRSPGHQPPRSRSGKQPQAPRKFKAGANGDPLDQFIDNRLKER